MVTNKDITNRIKQPLLGNAATFIDIASLAKHHTALSEEQKRILASAQKKLERNYYYYLGELALERKADLQKIIDLTNEECSVLSSIMNRHGYDFHSVQYYTLCDELKKTRQNSQKGNAGTGRRDAMLSLLLQEFGDDKLKSTLIPSTQPVIKDRLLVLSFTLAQQNKDGINQSHLQPSEINDALDEHLKRVIVRHFLAAMRSAIPTNDAVPQMSAKESVVSNVANNDVLEVKVPLGQVLLAAFNEGHIDMNKLSESAALVVNTGLNCALKIKRDLQ